LTKFCIIRVMHYGLRLPLAHLLQAVTTLRAEFKGEGKLGSCPGASTTKGPPQKSSKKLLPIRKHKKYSLKLIIWNKK